VTLVVRLVVIATFSRRMTSVSLYIVNSAFWDSSNVATVLEFYMRDTYIDARVCVYVLS
jgi:hypothetical protein